ncbi:MAG TPA: bifunctional phosphoribosylaminoimidazolecarboxamide formyltransferase/IMP cyclohydrolase [Dehalococcoidia bacterium]|nr:bifunctional phosphoribosylaminoimidazolecarboxamide formyltransferase/IMP cyclohydrolase [Dehalococcoidia bacterium]
MRAIISVSDKTGVADFAQKLSQLGFEIFSTGGTKKALAEAEVPVKSISEITGFPEILDGRVKTLHPAIYGGILARRDLPGHMAQLAENNIEAIDLVMVNLYPFVQTVSEKDVTFDEAIENIDIGGPSLIRAAAKNFPSVIVLVDPADYQPVLEKLEQGGVELAERKRLAQKAFQHVAIYDTAISQYLRQDAEGFPEEMTLALRERYSLRYGENPHQPAAFYAEQVVGRRKDIGITGARQLWGKELSYNNIMDADAAWEVVTDFSASTVAIIKHTNPCGLASQDNIAEAYRRALTGDSLAAYGGIVASNRAIDLAMANEIGKSFYEIVIAPEYEAEALETLKRKKDLRILISELPLSYNRAGYLDFRRVKGGFLVQIPDSLPEDSVSLHTVTRREPTPAEKKDLLFTWRAVKHVKSNAIVIAKNMTLLGMGAGQPSRVVSVELALERAGEQAKGSVLASDAMFPFADSVEMAARGGVTAIIQPGGSIRDEEAIKGANDYNMAMVFTGVRHFKH